MGNRHSGFPDFGLFTGSDLWKQKMIKELIEQWKDFKTEYMEKNPGIDEKNFRIIVMQRGEALFFDFIEWLSERQKN